MSTNFTAAPQALGYLFQARYALYLILSKQPEFKISIEGIDDIAFESNGTPQELLQLKHHVTSSYLTDSSPDLWKTLRVWSTAYKNNEIDPTETVLSIVTTASAPPDSVAFALTSNSGRNVQFALGKLNQVSLDSSNQSLKSSFNAFNALTENEKRFLLEAIHVIDCSPNIIDVIEKIKGRLRFSVRPQFLQSLYERLEGWWFGQVIEHLSGSSQMLISCQEVFTIIHELADQFRPDSLPIDRINIDPTDPVSDNRTFVTQLRKIGIQPKRVVKAITDHDKAYIQRSRWLREQLLLDDELERYECRLIDEWERHTLALQDQNNLWCSDNDDDLKNFGRLVYQWADRDANIRIRSNVIEEYIMRGSYHMLADKEPPQIWWHPKYTENHA